MGAGLYGRHVDACGRPPVRLFPLPGTAGNKAMACFAPPPAAPRAASAIYTHRPVRSERVGAKVRQRAMLNLGRRFAFPQGVRSLLCRRIENALGEQATLAPDCPPEVDAEARRQGDLPDRGPGDVRAVGTDTLHMARRARSALSMRACGRWTAGLDGASDNTGRRRAAARPHRPDHRARGAAADLPKARSAETRKRSATTASGLLSASWSTPEASCAVRKCLPGTSTNTTRWRKCSPPSPPSALSSSRAAASPPKTESLGSPRRAIAISSSGANAGAAWHTADALEWPHNIGPLLQSLRARPNSTRKKTSVAPAPDVAIQPRLRELRRHCRRCLRRLEPPDRHAKGNHVYRHAKVGAKGSVSIAAGITTIEYSGELGLTAHIMFAGIARGITP